MKDNKLTNEEIAKVFAVYFGCECYGKENDIIFKLDTHNLWSVMKSDTIKLLLTTLENITDEHAKNIVKFECTSAHDIEINKSFIYYKYADHDGIVDGFIGFDELSFVQAEYLKMKGYAVPLWFGIDHPCNGKTAIELNIAIEKTNP